MKAIKVKKCPDDCVFDWGDFFHKLDVATAHMVSEMNQPPFLLLLSRTSILKLLEYASKKASLQGGSLEPENAFLEVPSFLDYKDQPQDEVKERNSKSPTKH